MEEEGKVVLLVEEYGEEVKVKGNREEVSVGGRVRRGDDLGGRGRGRARRGGEIGGLVGKERNGRTEGPRVERRKQAISRLNNTREEIQSNRLTLTVLRSLTATTMSSSMASSSPKQEMRLSKTARQPILKSCLRKLSLKREERNFSKNPVTTEVKA